MPARPGAGRKPKPTALHKLHGTARKDRNSNPLEPQPLGDLTEPPNWMNDDQQAGWRYVIEHAPPGLLKLLDRGCLALFVEAEDMHRRASMALSRDNAARPETPGLALSKDGVWEISPHIIAIEKAAKIMFRCISELGFSPAARPRIRVTPAKSDDAKPDAPVDPWQALRIIPGGKAA